MTEERIKELCKHATHINITSDALGYTVGMRVGLFSRAVGISGTMSQEKQEDRILNLYQELRGNNRQVEQQNEDARKIR